MKSFSDETISKEQFSELEKKIGIAFTELQFLQRMKLDLLITQQKVNKMKLMIWAAGVASIISLLVAIFK